MSRVNTVITVSALSIFLVFGHAVQAEELLGWEIEWHTTVSGAGTITWQSGVDPVVTHNYSRSYSASFDADYKTDSWGIVQSGSASGSRTETTRTERLGWVCGVGQNLQYVDSYGTGSISETATGSGVGEQIFIQEQNDPDTGEYTVNVWANATCTGTLSSQTVDFNPGYCTPMNEETSSATDTCWPPEYYLARVQGTPEDDTNLVFSGSGSERAGCAITDHFASPDSCVGPITRSWTMTARKIVVPGIHGIELTQAIQVYQTLDELKRQLDRNNGFPPIPLVSYKPLAIRVVLDKVEQRTDYIVEAYWNGWPLDVPIALSVSPSCLPPYYDPSIDSSSRDNLAADCRTADFFVEAPHPGTHEVRVILKSAEDEVIQDEVLHIRTKESDAVGIGVVNICADKETDGSWKCVTRPIREVERAARMMREIYPTHQVVVQPTPRPHWVRLMAVPNQNPGLDSDIDDCYDRHGNPALGLSLHPVDSSLILTDSRWPLSRITQCEGDGWLFVTAKNVLKHYKATSYKLDWTGGITGGIQWFYYGPFRDNAAIIRGGAASGIGNPGIGKYYRGAIGLAVEDSPYQSVSAEYAFRRAKEILAHEVGHLIGRRHTNLATDPRLDANCEIAPDTRTDFPRYPDSSLWSGAPFPAADSPLRKEVGFHVKRKTVRRPNYYRDIMSYCSPKWITPFTYKKLHDFLDPPPPPPPGVEGEFWLISGFADEANVFFDAIYGVETTGHVETGEGTHRIEVRDGAGSVLFTRNFTPEKFEIDPPESGEVPQTDFGMFAELVPVQAGAASIAVRNSSGVVIADLAMEGAAPTVDITYPNGGEQLNGLQTITWTASDPDTAKDDIFYWLHYSTDGGSNWISLVQDIVETSVEIDFDELPGSSNALLKVTASDGINSGKDTSAIFSVSRKMPTVEIVFPENGQSGPVGETVFFEGYGYDADSGKLPSYMHDWTSSRDGLLASADRFSTSDLSEGTHVITLTALDADGNTATDSIVLTVGESSDSDGDGVDDAVDLCANTPMGEAVDGDGCSASQLDSDGDGVNDANDQCPGTPSGTAVDNNGCTMSQPTPSASSGGGGGSFSFAWVFFLWYWALLQSRHGVMLEIMRNVRLP